MNPARILVMKVCCLGDVVFSSPLPRALKKAWPEAEITYLTGAFSAPIAVRVPFVSRVLQMPDGALARLKLLYGLRREPFDLAFCLHKSLAASAGLWLTGAKVRVGFAWEGNQSFFTHSLPFDLGKHELRRYLSLLGPLGLEDAGEETALLLSADEKERGAQALRQAGWDGRPLAALFPGGGSNPGTVLLAKRWTPQGYGELAKELVKAGMQVLVLGGPGEEALGRALAQPLGRDAVDLSGKTSLEGLLALLANCAYFVGGDSGPTHFAAALGVPTLTLFGPTEPSNWAPLGPSHEFVWRQLPCSPCFTPREGVSKRFKACADWACLQELAPYTVINAARRQLQRLSLPGVRL